MWHVPSFPHCHYHISKSIQRIFLRGSSIVCVNTEFIAIMSLTWYECTDMRKNFCTSTHFWDANCIPKITRFLQNNMNTMVFVEILLLINHLIISKFKQIILSKNIWLSHCGDTKIAIRQKWNMPYRKSCYW